MSVKIELLPLAKIQWSELCQVENCHLLERVTMDVDNEAVFARIAGKLHYVGTSEEIKTILGGGRK